MPRYPAVVADASPLISLEKLTGGFSLLRYTCSTLLVPEAVASEISHFLPAGEDYFEHHGVRRFCEVVVAPADQISLQTDQANRFGNLGRGERFAIELARAKGLPLLVEERLARRLARECGLRVFGAAAVIRIAQEEGGIEISRAEALLHSLYRANRINRKVLAHILRALGP